MRLLTVIGFTLIQAVPGIAQQRGNTLPRVGDRLPVVTAYDANGREFSLTELRGEYSVLVFGCLT